ncbi:hypothetical protein AYI69_g3475 [Smittium culicis]|uniref:Uncharacterized protein n=1 Tax=Smittium culicis TaxID=133412 RepID=A0A1R1YJJ7_9FUNG|nr:hypothetical protein AYI69_g3475 [Smittium culicis]
MQSFKKKLSKDEIEFLRRAWWSYYIHENGSYLFSLRYPPYQEMDICVNYPTNDFFWKYGGQVAECYLQR